MNKKIYTTIAIIITLVLSYYGYDKYGKTNEVVKPVVVIDECDPLNYIIDGSAKKFIPPSSMSTPLVRKNYNSLTLAEQQNIEYAIAKMKLLIDTDPLSFKFQTMIHNGPVHPTDKTIPFMTCQHDDCCFFLAWHRMYIYFFERILMSKMNPSLAKPALPFWDFQDITIPATSTGTPKITGCIPWRFRYPANSSNPLYDAERAPKFNQYPIGASFYKSVKITAFDNAITDINPSTINNYNYFDFQNSIYNAHGNIHSVIGRWNVPPPTGTGADVLKEGDLGNLKTAATDPLFFLIHANIDRMWEMWLNLYPRNMNPNSACNAFWWNRQFVFYDETGKKIYLTGGDIINTASTTLNYKYDGVTVPAIKSRGCSISKPVEKCPIFPKGSFFVYLIDANVKDVYTTINSNLFKTSSKLQELLTSNPQAKFTFVDSTSNGDNIYIELENIKTTKEPDGVVEIYIAEKEQLLVKVPQSIAFAGIINLFDVQKNTMLKKVQRINITELVKKQGLNYASLTKLKVGFFARGNVMDGIEMPTNVALKIGKLTIAVYKNNELVASNN
jgi:hypothetical protein